MALRRNPARSTRSTAATPSTLEHEWFPDIKNPVSIAHKRINILNREAYLSEIFARADDFLMFIAFAKKGGKRRHHGVLPEPAQSGDPICLSPTEGKLGAKICMQLFNGSEPSWEAVVQSVKALQQQISAFQLEDRHWSACLSQYSLIYSSNSSVGLLKITHDRRKATFGLKAKRFIPPGSYIAETCSSMSLNLTCKPGPSTIESALGQLGPLGPRLILGPFRLVNHDCNPNAQILPIAGTHACVIVVTKEAGIKANEEITVKYQQSGYYGEECLCSSCTGVDTSDLSVLKPSLQQCGASTPCEVIK